MDAQRLGLYCEPLRDFRDKLDQLIISLVNNLTERDLSEGAVTAKIKVIREIKTGPDHRAYTLVRMEPTVSMKIGASGSAVCEKSGMMILQYNQDGTAVIGENQISVDEYIRQMDGRMEEGA